MICRACKGWIQNTPIWWSLRDEAGILYASPFCCVECVPAVWRSHAD